MKIVIDIPEDMYNDAEILMVKELPELKKIIANGTPLNSCEICKFKHRCTRRPAGNAIIVNCFKFKKEENDEAVN